MTHEVKITTIAANGFDFLCRNSGLENDGELVIFLHGFPESSIIWENILKKLAEKGYKCLAPNQRGYSEGARPQGIENYTTRILASDVIALAESVGEYEKFHLVGHDWGAGVGWAVVTLFPERIQSWTAMSTPHSKAFEWAIAEDQEQQKQSQYIFEFLEPDLPEESIMKNDCSRLRELWQGLDTRHIQDYLEIFRKPESCTATINWYRAMLLIKPCEKNPKISFGGVNIPTCFIWGNNDFALCKAGVEKSHSYMRGYYKFVELEGAGHWLIENNEEDCIREIMEHIEKHSIENNILKLNKEK
jgi:pimeloyl-ACP methyl ester carboxylesterase